MQIKLKSSEAARAGESLRQAVTDSSSVKAAPMLMQFYIEYGRRNDTATDCIQNEHLRH
jgi:hypothetical protein